MTHTQMKVLSLLWLLVAVGSCRSLTDAGPVEPSYALDPPMHGALADFVKRVGQRLGDDQSGFLLLDNNARNLSWRLAMIDSATRSLDLQTYLWAQDFSGRLLISRIWQAAERGVQVRLLVDDFLLRVADRNVATLAEHPNIQIRIWNPGQRRQLGRNLQFLTRLRELNHRMHNKLLIADNMVVVSGGRNVADSYFGLAGQYNFFDIDLLGTGAFVRETSDMFDRYWNTPQAIPARALHHRGTAADIPALMSSVRERLERADQRKVYALDPQTWDAWLQDEADAMIGGAAEVIYDKPGEREPSQDAVFGLQRYFEGATSEALLLTPYLVPGEVFFAAAAELEARGVEMRILTNSLGSTNQTVVHSAYARTRVPLLEAGLDVYEMRYDAALKDAIDTPPAISTWVGLHGKAAVIDRRRVFVGSFNLSPRSKSLNTEMGLLVDSPRLAAELAELIDTAMSPENAWQLKLDESGRLAWESSDGTLTKQPSQTFRRRLTSGIFGLFPLEKHL